MKMTLYEGDCFTVLPQHVPDESVDLIYLDPPFYTNRNFNAFDDRFESMDVYIGWLKFRIRECYRVLKPTGSIYVHCDWHASSYIRVMMDMIFGYNNFQNEIVWCYRKWEIKQKQFVRSHDMIFMYTKSNDNVFNTLYVPLSESTLKRWKGKKQKKIAGADGKLVDAGASGESEDSAMPDWWYIPHINSQSNERLGYDTQKPEALLERIIKASSKPGDLILDPFCGCGTALAVAQRLGRRWIGIDINPDAVELAEKRTKTQQQRLIL